ncbi:unnamed protein product [Thelazia callipaeda]|uniref:Peptidase_MA_2 domain-containing protein n=1 Tax=Thelazia callipaeda TaxID=103827 RepID=A0A158RAM2_THECL|nr:unnamed protein product [Thelazia callipaeda]
MLIVQCALIVAIWGPFGGFGIQPWDRHFGTEINLLETSKHPVYDRKTRRLVNAVKQKLDSNERLIVLSCVKQCYHAQTQIPQWIREFSEQNNETTYGRSLSYQFYGSWRNNGIFNDYSAQNASKPHLVYVVSGRLFRYDSNLANKSEFFSFLKSHELGGAKTVQTWEQLESIINLAELCHGEKQVLLVADNDRCPVRHYELIVRAFDGIVNYSFYEIETPLLTDMYIELYTRLPELPFVCQLILLMQNSGYVWISADADVHELIIAVESLQNLKCDRGSSSDWYPIREQLTALERDYLRENEQASTLVSKPNYILVGATGGIAVVALAISIFWGLNGSTFARQ